MIGKTDRVILLKGDATKWYDQAIFIVNQNTPAGKMPVDFVAEAEKIINNYMTREKKTPAAAQSFAAAPDSTAAPALASAPKKPKSRFDFALNLMMILACIAIIVVFLYGITA